ncbi:glutathione S-transferase [Azospirillum fermentarium]|uniref:glutathione transferase GstA n=1 Tax=Azospirillum fermentarium TaxID=1233114 RepID=UPI0022275EDB|nr:glutathione transferase GstA [Azospirillum fermentarium]MCW2246915.1 glutathione S-transferase [Azospirillum fermentarium]
MKLYYKPGACSLSPHIVAHEAGLAVQAVKVDLVTKTLEDGSDYRAVAPRGQVPALLLDNGALLTEGAVIVQYLADQAPDSGLLPPAGSFERYKVQEWLNFIGSEIHKSYSPLFRPDTPEAYKPIARANVAAKLAVLDAALAGKPYLTGDTFTVADAYAYTVSRWAGHAGVDVGGLANLKAFAARVADRPAVRAALAAEGLA